MKYYFQTRLFIYCALVVIIRSDRLHFGHSIKTNAKESELGFYTFEMTPMHDVQNCIESCKAKKQCKVINFNNRVGLCYHVGFSNNTLTDDDVRLEDFREEKPGFSYGNKREWDMTDYTQCEACNEIGVCTMDENNFLSKCQNSGCRLPEEKSNAIYHGNMFSVGNKIEYECKAGYKSNSTFPLTATCLENGTWSFSGFECLPEAVFESDIIKHENNFYKINDVSQNWYNANKTCSDLKMHLVYMKTIEEQAYLKSILDSSKCYWVGGYRRNQAVQEVYWLDAEIISTSLEWKDGQPDNYHNSQDCIQITETTLYLNDKECSTTCFAICELR